MVANSIKIISTIGIILCITSLYVLTFRQTIITNFTKQYFIKRTALKAEDASDYIISNGLKLLKTIRIKKELILQIETNAKECKNDPEKFVNKLISQESHKSGKTLKLLKKLPEKIKFLAEVKLHFQHSIQNLITGLYIFFISNLIGLSLVAYFIFIKKIKDKSLLIPSFLIITSIIYSSSVYLNQNWFLNILLDTHMGIWYPFLVIASYANYYQKFRNKELTTEILKDLTD